MMIETARPQKLLRISHELFMGWLTTGNNVPVRVDQGLPPDAQFCGADYDAYSDCFLFVFESQEWEPTPFGEKLPYLDVTLRGVDCGNI